MCSGSSKLESRNVTQCSVYSAHCTVHSCWGGGGRGCVSNSGTLASNGQNTTRPKYNDDISLLISQYLISVQAPLFQCSVQIVSTIENRLVRLRVSSEEVNRTVQQLGKKSRKPEVEKIRQVLGKFGPTAHSQQDVQKLQMSWKRVYILENMPTSQGGSAHVIW